MIRGDNRRYLDVTRVNFYCFPTFPRRIIRVVSSGPHPRNFRFRSIPCLLPDYSLQPLQLRRGHRARSIGSLIGKNRAPRRGGDSLCMCVCVCLCVCRTEEKEYPKKRCLRPAHQTLFHGGDPPRSTSLSSLSHSPSRSRSQSFLPRDDAPFRALPSLSFSSLPATTSRKSVDFR